jgi:modulator of FtsH protease
MQDQNYIASFYGNTKTIAINSVLRKTYFLLALTIGFSALTATFGVMHNATVSPWLAIIGMFGLLFLTQALRNSRLGIAATFAFTGFMGYVLAPTLNFYLHNFTNGQALVLTALTGTAVIFLGLSLYTIISRKDFSFMGGFLFVAILAAFVASIAALVFHMPMLQVLVSGAFMLICSALIMFHTSQILNGGETNYIMATISIYVALLNIFVSLLNILGIFGGSRR